MAHLAVQSKAIARPVKILTPLIVRELAAGHAAGLEHYRHAGELLIEAREQVAPFKWTAWLSKNFALSKQTASDYMRLAERAADDPRVMQQPTLTAAIGRSQSDAAQRTGPYRPIREFTARVDVDALAQQRQVRADEISLHRELAIELVDIGYKALATRLHPDRGGSKDAMRRLNRVRDELKSVAETRRFE